MKIWLNKTSGTYYDDKSVRNGLRLRFEPDVDAEVKRAIKDFAVWLRANYRFPIRLVVYVKAAERIKALDGDMVYGIFLELYDHMEEPYIKLAVGDYNELCVKRGKDNALASLLHCLAHEITHYYQWCVCADITDRQKEYQATYYASKIIDAYAETREHP